MVAGVFWILQIQARPKLYLTLFQKAVFLWIWMKGGMEVLWTQITDNGHLLN